MHVESVRQHFFDQLSAEQLLALADIQMTLLEHLLPIGQRTRRRAIEGARARTCPTRALTGPDGAVRTGAGACSPTASSPGACRSGTAPSTRCSPTCATATGSPRRSSATSSPPGSSPGSSTQLALARLADRGYAPMLVRGGILLAMAAMIGSAVATEFWAFLVARLLLGLGSGAVGPAMRRIVITREPDAVGANLGRLAAFDVAGFMLGPLVAAVVAEAFGIRAPFVFLAAVFVGVFVLASRLDLTAGTAVSTPAVSCAGCSRAPRSRPRSRRASRST